MVVSNQFVDRCVSMRSFSRHVYIVYALPIYEARNSDNNVLQCGPHHASSVLERSTFVLYVRLCLLCGLLGVGLGSFEQRWAALYSCGQLWAALGGFGKLFAFLGNSWHFWAALGSWSSIWLSQSRTDQ